jgi:hypothetical protein
MLSAAKHARLATLTFVLSLTFVGCGGDSSGSGKDANAGAGGNAASAGNAGAKNTGNAGGSAGFAASGASTGGALACGAGQHVGGASNEGGSTSHLGGETSAGGNASGGDAAAGAGGASETSDPCAACNPKTDYCQRTIGGPPGAMPHYQCLALPAGCGNKPSCSCLASVSCGAQCMATAGDGLLMTTCLAP